MMAILRFSIIIFITLNLISSIQVFGNLVFEDGYTVSTIIDGNKLGINPHSVLSRSVPFDDLVILDSSSNAFFTASFPISQDSEVKRLTGNGVAGYSDGEFSAAMFNKPRSFAVDLKGNVYVADKNNRVIRKISSSGVSTIAGGYTRKTGYIDGPAQNASFSDDFELVFVPQICALLISDHGSKVVRQIHLKPEDCAGGTNSGSVLGATSIWILGLGISCAIGLIIGFTARPYIVRHDGSKTLFFNETWKHCLIKLGTQVKILCFEIKNALASSRLYLPIKKLILLGLFQISLMFSINFVESRISDVLSDNNLSNSEAKQSDMFAEDLIDYSFSLSGQLELPDTTKTNEDKSSDYLSNSRGRLDGMIQANLMGFVEATTKRHEVEESLFPGVGLVKRRENSVAFCMY